MADTEETKKDEPEVDIPRSVEETRPEPEGQMTEITLESSKTTKPSAGTVDDLQPIRPSIADRFFGSVKSVPRKFRSLYPPGAKEELKELSKIAWPVILAQFLSIFPVTVSLLFCGHLGKEQLDAVALGLTFINLTGISIGFGLTTALDTLLSQTYGGANKQRVGVIIQRGTIIILLFCFPCWALYLNTELLLKALRQNEEVSSLAGLYVTVFIPGFPGFLLLQVLNKYLQNQNIVLPSVVIGLVMNAFNAALHAAFIYGFNWGVQGAAGAFVISCWFGSIVTIIYIKVKNLHKETWGGWTTECLQEWGLFIHLAIPGMLMMGIEFWNYEIGTFVSGLLGKNDLAAQAIIYQMTSFAFMIPIGLSVAASIRVGQFLGSGKPMEAMTASRISISIVCGTSLLTGLIYAAFKDLIPHVFTPDRDVAAYVGRLLLNLALSQFFDGIQGVCSGILRGCGQQKLGAIVNFMGFYVIGLPIGLTLMLRTYLRVAGYWWGNTLATFTQAVVFNIIVYKMEWVKESEQARIRAGVELKEKKEDKQERRESQRKIDVPEPIDINDSKTLPELDGNFEMDIERETQLISLTRLPMKTLIIRRSLAVLVAVMSGVVGLIISRTVKI